MKKPINYNYNATDYEIYWNEYRGYEINIDVLNIIVANMKKKLIIVIHRLVSTQVRFLKRK